MVCCFLKKNYDPSGQELALLMSQNSAGQNELLCRNKRGKAACWKGGTIKEIEKEGYAPYSFHGRIVLIAKNKLHLKQNNTAALGAANYLALSKKEHLEKQKKKNRIIVVVCNFFDKLRNKYKGLGWNKSSEVAEKLEAELTRVNQVVDENHQKPNNQKPSEKPPELSSENNAKIPPVLKHEEKPKSAEPKHNEKKAQTEDLKTAAKPIKPKEPQQATQNQQQKTPTPLPAVIANNRMAKQFFDKNKTKITQLTLDFKKIPEKERGKFSALFKDIEGNHLTQVDQKIKGAFERAEEKAYNQCLELVKYFAPEEEQGLPPLQTSTAPYLIDWALYCCMPTLRETIVKSTISDPNLSLELIECYLNKIYEYSLENSLPKEFLYSVSLLTQLYLKKKPEGPVSLDFLKGMMVVCSRDVNSNQVAHLLNPDNGSEKKVPVWERLTDYQKLVLVEFEQARTSTLGASPLYDKLYNDYYKNEKNNHFRRLCDEQGLQSFFPTPEQKNIVINEWKKKAQKPKETNEGKVIKIPDRRYWHVGMSDEDYLSLVSYRERKEIKLLKNNLKNLQPDDCIHLNANLYRMLIFYIQQVDKVEKLIDFISYQTGKDICDPDCFSTKDGQKALICVFRYATENSLEAFLEYKPPVREAKPLLQTMDEPALLLCLSTLYSKKTDPTIEQKASYAITYTLLQEYRLRNGGEQFKPTSPLPKEIEKGIELLFLGNHPLRNEIKNKFQPYAS